MTSFRNLLHRAKDLEARAAARLLDALVIVIATNSEEAERQEREQIAAILAKVGLAEWPANAPEPLVIRVLKFPDSAGQQSTHVLPASGGTEIDHG